MTKKNISPPAEDSTASSASSSLGTSRPGSSSGAPKPIRRVQFGSGEALDYLNNRHTFDLRDVNSPTSTDAAVQSRQIRPVQSPPIYLTSPECSPSGRIYPRQDFVDIPIDTDEFEQATRDLPNPPKLKMPSKVFSLVNEKEKMSNEKHEQLSPQERASRHSLLSGGNHSTRSSSPSSPSSPTLSAYSVGAGVSQGGFSVGEVPLLDLGNSSPTGEKEQTERPKVTATKEAHDLVRKHTQRYLSPYGSDTPDPGSNYPSVPPRSGATTPINHRHEDYVPPPERYRGGVLSSLLKLYAAPEASSTSDHQRKHTRVDSAGSLPATSGRSTPKWYKSNNTSTSSLGTLLASSSATLMAPTANNSSPRVERPKFKHKPHSGGVVGAWKNFSRPNLAEEIKITIHIAETLSRQKYILKLCRTLMLYGAPTHRLEEYMKMTTRVLEIDGQFVYIPNCMIVSFGDSSTHTSNMQIVRTHQATDLGKLHDTHIVYKEVVHDIIGVEEAIQRLDDIMKRKEKHNRWTLVLVFGLASACVGPFGFKAGPQDMPILFLLGCIVGFLQLIVAPSSELFGNVFEISAAILTSFLARAFGSINGGSLFCFSALAQASIALILPGYIILCGSLELLSKNIVSGSVRMFYAIIYSLLLGFGITIGSALYGLLDKNAISATTCQSHLDWRWNFLFVPPFALCLLVINQARWRQAPVMVAIALAGYVVNFFSSRRFSSQPQVANALGAFTIGVLGNLYSRVGHGLAFAAMLPAIFVQVPSGLAAQGSLISGIQSADAITTKGGGASQDSVYDNVVLDFGFSMIEVAIGITVGLFAAALCVYPFGKKRSGLFSF